LYINLAKAYHSSYVGEKTCKIGKKEKKEIAIIKQEKNID